jgi:hypothetical protein
MKLWFTLLMSFLIISNLLAIYYLDPVMHRWFRFGATLIFLLIYIFKYFTRYRVLLVFLLLTLCDGLLVFYEIPEIRNLIYLTRILAYFLIISMIVPSLSKLILNLFTISITVFILIIDLYLLNVMAESLPGAEQTPVFLILFYSLGIASLALAATSLSYLNRFSNKRAFFLVLLSFGCILSDMFFYNSYYLGFVEFNYLDRLVNILAIGAFLLFSRELLKKPKEIKVVDLVNF